MLKLRKNKGITLIALVITIIVLLILAGVAIGQLTNSGLFNKTQVAKETYTYEAEQEQLEIAIANLKMEILANNGGTPTLDDLKAFLEASKFNGEYLVELFYEPLAATEDVSTTPVYAKVTHIPTKFVFYVNGKLVVIGGEKSEKAVASVTNDRAEIESTIIDGLNIEAEAIGNYINITVTSSENDNIIGYHAFVVEKNNEDNIYTKVTESSQMSIKNLEFSTDYNVYVIAYDKYNNYKKTETLELTTDEGIPVARIESNSLVSYFGKTVNYKGDDNWAILYIGDEFAADGRHMYLISKTARWSGKPSANGNISNTVLQQPSGQNLLAWARSSNSNKTSNGALKTWSMLTASNYTTYCDNTIAEWAIGGPTVDLYFKAYNLKNKTSIGYNSDFNNTGYNYTMGSSLNNSFNLSNTVFWFASPGSYGTEWVEILSGSSTWCYADKDGNVSFNPVVCLKKTVKIFEENNVYHIVE